MNSTAENIDCMIGMSRYPDKYFELAIVDPPYGIGETGERSTRSHKSDKWKNPGVKKYLIKNWDKSIPHKDYFNELFRVSQNQIIFGANYFSQYLRGSMGWIFWDKLTSNNDFSDGELLYTSFQKGLRKIELLWNGFQRCEIVDKIHPTQKPVKLYKWLLDKYAKQGDKILDTHLGSGSSRIACYDYGFDFTGFELDKDYFEAQEQRFKNHISQTHLFK